MRGRTWAATIAALALALAGLLAGAGPAQAATNYCGVSGAIENFVSTSVYNASVCSANPPEYLGNGDYGYTIRITDLNETDPCVVASRRLNWPGQPAAFDTFFIVCGGTDRPYNRQWDPPCNDGQNGTVTVRFQVGGSYTRDVTVDPPDCNP